MSKREESLNDEAIFLCLVRGCVVSACQEETDVFNNSTHGEQNGGWSHDGNPPDWSHWSAGTGWWPLWCSVQRYPVTHHTHTHQRQWHTVTHTHSVDRVTEHTPVESAWHLRWRFWRRSHLSDSRTSRVWWSWRTAGSAPGSQTLLTSAAWPDNSTHSSLNDTTNNNMSKNNTPETLRVPVDKQNTKQVWVMCETFEQCGVKDKNLEIYRLNTFSIIICPEWPNHR